jgi:cytochrome P450
LIRPSFTKLRMSDSSLFESHFQNLLAVLPAANPVSGMVDIDLLPLIFRMTLDSATEVLLGRSFNSLLEPPGSPSLGFMAAFDYAQLKTHSRYLMDRGYMKPLGKLLTLLWPDTWDEFDSSCATVQRFVDEIVADLLLKQDKNHLYGKDGAEGHDEEESGRPGKKYVFLEELAKETRHPIELRDEILNMLVAGRDTTASLLSTALFTLARRRDVWARVRAEVLETFGDRIPEYEVLRNLKQMRNLFNECEAPFLPSNCYE